MARTTGQRRWTARMLAVAAVAGGMSFGWAAAARSPAATPATPVEERKPADGKKPAGEPDAPPKTDPSPKPEAATKPARADAATTRPAGTDGELLRPTGPTATGPATNPTTKPAIEVSAEARSLLDRVRDAYQGVRGLTLAGTITGDFDLNGERQTYRAEFDATFRSFGEFKHRLRELPTADGGPPAADGDAGPAAVGSPVTVGGTGKKLYVFEPRYGYYYQVNVPNERTGEALGKSVNGLLAQQNPSLLLAVVADASAELLDGPDAAEKVADVAIAGTPCPALRFTFGKELVMTVAFDPKTSLVRRATFDHRGLAEAKKQQDVKRADVTIDYATTEVAADPDAVAALRPEAFAWTPPSNTRDVTASAGGADLDGFDDAAAQALVGKPAPDFTLPGLDGADVKLSDLKGRVVLLDFWATWCGPCRESLPHLDEIYKERKDKGLKAYAVDLRESEGAVRAFVEKAKLGLPVLLDKDGKVAKSFGVGGVPQTVVIDKAGTVVKVVVGGGAHEQIKAAIDEAMAK